MKSSQKNKQVRSAKAQQILKDITVSDSDDSSSFQENQNSNSSSSSKILANYARPTQSSNLKQKASAIANLPKTSSNQQLQQKDAEFALVQFLKCNKFEIVPLSIFLWERDDIVGGRQYVLKYADELPNVKAITVGNYDVCLRVLIQLRKENQSIIVSTSSTNINSKNELDSAVYKIKEHEETIRVKNDTISRLNAEVKNLKQEVLCLRDTYKQDDIQKLLRLSKITIQCL